MPHGDVAEVDVDRAGGQALVADGAVVGHVVHLGEVAPREPAAGLLLVQEGLDDEPGAEDLVARRIEQVGPRDMGHALGLALAAAQAVLDVVVQGAEFGLLQDDGLLLHQAQRRRIGPRKPGTGHELAAVEPGLRVHPPLVVHEGGELVGPEELELGDADAVLAGDDAAQVRGQGHDAPDDGGPPPGAWRSRRSGPGCWCAHCRPRRACAGRRRGASPAPGRGCRAGARAPPARSWPPKISSSRAPTSSR